MTPILWFRRQVGHRDVEVWLSTVRITKTLRGCLGYAEEQANGTIAIWVESATSRLTQDVTVLHEFNHVAAWDAKLDYGEEERAYSACEPVWPILVSCGLRWPRRPKGAAELERWARRKATKQ